MNEEKVDVIWEVIGKKGLKCSIQHAPKLNLARDWSMPLTVDSYPWDLETHFVAVFFSTG